MNSTPIIESILLSPKYQSNLSKSNFGSDSDSPIVNHLAILPSFPEFRSTSKRKNSFLIASKINPNESGTLEDSKSSFSRSLGLFPMASPKQEGNGTIKPSSFSRVGVPLIFSSFVENNLSLPKTPKKSEYRKGNTGQPEKGDTSQSGDTTPNVDQSGAFQSKAEEVSKKLESETTGPAAVLEKPEVQRQSLLRKLKTRKIDADDFTEHQLIDVIFLYSKLFLQRLSKHFFLFLTQRFFILII